MPACLPVVLHQSSADKAYEAALAASMATTKAATKKVETVTAELEKLQAKYNKVVKEGTEQDEIIVMLQQQIQQGTTTCTLLLCR